MRATLAAIEAAAEARDVGALKDEVLLFCPLAAPSRTRVVSGGDEKLIPTGVIESVFTNAEK